MPQPANDNHARSAAADEIGRGRLCPMCRKPQVPAFRPFCSKRCADLDLARWLGGRYAIPADPIEGEEAVAGAPVREDDS